MSTQETRETYCCECETHFALPGKPLCPVCLDDEMQEVRERTEEAS